MSNLIWGATRQSAQNCGMPVAYCGMQNAPGQDLDVLDERAPVGGAPRALVERRERLHQVHVDVERLAVAAAAARPASRPVALEHFEVSAVLRVGTVPLNKVERGLRVLDAAWVSGRERVFAQCVDREAEAVQDLLVGLHVPAPVDGPEEPAVLRIPHLRQEEVDAVPREVGADAAAVPGPVRRRHRVDAAGLGDERLLVLAGVPALAVEVRDEPAVHIVSAAREPEGQQVPGQMPARFVPRRLDRVLSHDRVSSASTGWPPVRSPAAGGGRRP